MHVLSSNCAAVVAHAGVCRSAACRCTVDTVTQSCVAGACEWHCASMCECTLVRACVCVCICRSKACLSRRRRDAVSVRAQGFVWPGVDTGGQCCCPNSDDCGHGEAGRVRERGNVADTQMRTRTQNHPQTVRRSDNRARWVWGMVVHVRASRVKRLLCACGCVMYLLLLAGDVDSRWFDSLCRCCRCRVVELQQQRP